MTSNRTLKDYKYIYEQMVALEDSHWWFRVHYAWIRDLLSPYLNSGKKVLDVGCGPGVCSERLPSSVSRTLLDIRLRALHYCHFQADARVCADASSIPFREEAFDGVICSDLLHQCDVADPGRVVGEVWRVCRPGGVILLVEPALRCLFGPHDEVENGCRRYTTGELMELFSEYPISPLRRTYLHMLMFIPTFLVRRVFSRFSDRRQTDLALGNRLTNTVSLAIESCERRLGRVFSLPFGTSAAVLVRRE